MGVRDGVRGVRDGVRRMRDGVRGVTREKLRMDNGMQSLPT